MKIIRFLLNWSISRYNKEGKSETLPPLTYGRFQHGCASYINNDDKQVRKFIITKYCHDLRQSQVYLVAGGLNGPRMRGSLRSTELLVKGDKEWKVVRRRKTNIEELVIRWSQLEKGRMETGLSGLRGASLDNTVYMFGEDLLSSLTFVSPYNNFFRRSSR